jgi:LydA holin phage, holin superfamily III
MDNNDPRYAWLQAIALAAFAAFAGALGYVMRTMDAHLPVTFWPTFVQGLAAGFVGLLVMMICQSVGLSWQWMAVSVGVSGWLGATASIQVIQQLVWKKLGLNRRPDDGNSEQ